MGRSPHNGLGALLGFDRVSELGGVLHENAGADEYGFRTQLHDERSIRRRSDSAGRKIRDGQLPFLGHNADQFVRRAVLFGFGVELFLAEHGEDFHFLHDLADVLDGMHDVAGAGFALGANHGRAFRDTAEGFAQVARAAYERDLEGVFVDVMSFVGWGQDLGLVDVVDPELFEKLGLGEVADAALGHDWDRHGGHDLANLFGRSHAGDTTLGADLRGDALERHDRDRPGALGDFGLLRISDVHNDATLEHFGEAGLQAQAGGVSVLRSV